MSRTLSKEDGAYVAEVLDKLQSNPTNQDLDYLVEAHTYVGYLAAVAQGAADEAEAIRKYAEAESILAIKSQEPKVTGVILESSATRATQKERMAEIVARTQARKIYNLQQSIEQAINAIKYLGRQTGVSLPNGK
jgi:hypothetical protein